MDTKYRKLIPVIYLSGSAAVAGLKDAAIVSEDPAALAAQYDNGFTDALMIFDLSDTDREQEAHHDLIREICGRVRIPVFAAGRVRRMEDVKKFLYAGCAMAFLNLAKKENAELAAEVADKFGADKIGACFSDTEQVRENEPLLTGNVSCLLYVGDGPLEGLSAITMPVPVIVQISGDMCVKQSLTPAFIHGVTGYGVNKRIGKLQHVRGKLNYNMTVSTGRMTYWSRSRQEIWVKGLTSGHFQYVHSLTADCDMDTLLAKVEQIGAACHTGSHSCFFNEVLTEEGKESFNPQKVLLSDYQTIVDRRDHPKKGSYTNYLFDKGIDKMLKKLGEEATEIVIAAKNPNPNEIVYEISDYLYHLMVVMAEKGITWEDVAEELARRQKKEN